MLTDIFIAKSLFAAVTTVFFGVCLARKWYRTIFIFIGTGLALIGTVGLLTGQLIQQYNAAPPLTGLAAAIGNIFLIVASLFVIFFSIKRKQIRAKKTPEPAVSPNGGPAERVDNSEGGGGPPSPS